MTYERPAENEWVQPVRKGYKVRCCDCGMVHQMDFRVHEGRVQFRARRDKRATSASRRYRPWDWCGPNGLEKRI